MPKKKDSAKIDDPKTRAFLATFLSIVGFILALVLWKDDDYVMFYAKQSMVIFIAAIVASIINSALVIISVIGWMIMAGLNIIVLVLWVLSWLYALSGEKKDVILIGEYARKIKL